MVNKKEKTEESKELALREADQLAEMKLPTPSHVMKWLAPGIDMQTAVLFIKTAQEYELNPWKKEIMLMPFGSGQDKRYSIVIGYQVFLGRARRDPNYMYFKAGLLYTDAKPGGQATGAFCEIYRKDWKEPFRHEIDANEYDKGYSTWKSHRNTMLKKVAICQAHRLAYPDELAGLPAIDPGVVDDDGLTEAEVLDANAKRENGGNDRPKIDPDFSEAPAEESGQPELGLGGKQNFTPAEPEQISAIQSLLKIAKKKKRNADTVASAENALADHQAAVAAGEKGMSEEYAGNLISELQAA